MTREVGTKEIVLVYDATEIGMRIRVTDHKAYVVGYSVDDILLWTNESGFRPVANLAGELSAWITPRRRASLNQIVNHYERIKTDIEQALYDLSNPSAPFPIELTPLERSWLVRLTREAQQNSPDAIELKSLYNKIYATFKEQVK